ncbi:MAG: GNAT family N-acetyltransferase [Chloroflexi bacterium]|nr:GNAT family N-acetyltransferase [Chloroflexota bacterium]
MTMPVLETEHLMIRPFVMEDLAEVYQLLDAADGQAAPGPADSGYDGSKALEERRRWLRWSILNYEELARLHQPPYGDRAVVLKTGGGLIGACGYAPILGPFDQLPGFGMQEMTVPARFFTSEIGLFYAFLPAFWGQGYATEAARALVEFAFAQLRLKRIVATTTYNNDRSMGVMARLGMRVERNPFPEPPWFQVVGVLENH